MLVPTKLEFTQPRNRSPCNRLPPSLGTMLVYTPPAETDSRNVCPRRLGEHPRQWFPANSSAYRVEGQDASNGTLPSFPTQNQPGVDAIQEVAVQTSNFAAEYGQVGGGFLNITMKSGTNQFHGGAYEYYVNEFLNAGQPYTDDGTGHNLRPRNRRNDWGFTVGGPVWIPKLYNGPDKTFFFV